MEMVVSESVVCTEDGRFQIMLQSAHVPSLAWLSIPQHDVLFLLSVTGMYRPLAKHKLLVNAHISELVLPARMIQVTDLTPCLI